MAEQYRIEVYSDDWIEIITAMVGRAARAAGTDKPPVTISYKADSAVYTIDKDFLSSDMLAAAIGAKPDAVSGATDIVLKPLASAKWPKPSVAYTGHA